MFNDTLYLFIINYCVGIVTIMPVITTNYYNGMQNIL